MIPRQDREEARKRGASTTAGRQLLWLVPAIVAAAAFWLVAPTGAAPSASSVTAAELRPQPSKADTDKGRVFTDGCLVDQESKATKRCVYAKRKSRKTVVLFGDSEAMQFFPPLLRIARHNGWRLITRLRAGCPPAAVHFAGRCDNWRDATLDLIARKDKPKLVVVTSGVAYTVVRNGKRLSSKASRRWLRKGYSRTLRRLRRTGARVAVVKDTPRAPRDIPDCVMKHSQDPNGCRFSRKQPTNRNFDRNAARTVRGAKLINPTPVVCPGGTCHVVAGDVLVYRDDVHFTATYAATLTLWLRDKLPPPAG